MSKSDNSKDHISPPLIVETLVNGGNGLIRYDGKVIFIPKVAAGDEVRFKITSSKKSYAEGELVELVSPSGDRREPLCPVADECGGCQWQHLPYNIQAQWKHFLFKETLIRKCNLPADSILDIMEAPEEFNYRSRVQVKCFKTKSNFITGFYRSKSRFVINVDSCPLISEGMNRILSSFREIISDTRHATYIPQVDLATDSNGKYAVTVHYLGHNKDDLIATLMPLADLADIIVKSGAKAIRSVIAGDGYLHIATGVPDLNLRYEVGSFAQINLKQNQRMIAYVMGLIPWTGSETVLDLFCGMGNFTLPIATKVIKVIGIEDSSSSIKMARSNAKQMNINNVSFICANAEKAIDEVLDQNTVDILILDPPRSGAYSITKKIANSGINHIVYVSCDTQTLARDLEHLIKNGYDLISSQPLDMFPQTYHCESISYLKKNHLPKK